MAQFPNKSLNQTAVYWGTPVENGYGGFTYASGVEVDCRWVEKREVITLLNGDQFVSHARVQLAQDVDEQGKLFLGDLDDLDSAAEENPTDTEVAFTIMKFDKAPTMKGTRFYRRAFL